MMTHFLKAHEETHCYPAMWVVEYSYPTRRMAVMLPNAIAHRERRCLSSSQCSANIELELNDVRMSTVDCQLSTQTNVSVSVQPLGIYQQQSRQLQPKQQTSVASD